jgi:hypothetical protein
MLFTADMRRAVMPGGRGDASATRRKLSARCCPHSGGAHGWAWRSISARRTDASSWMRRGRPSIEMAAQGSTSVGYVGKFSTNCITIVSVRANTPLTDLMVSGFAAFTTIDGMTTVPASSRIDLGGKWKNSEGAR